MPEANVEPLAPRVDPARATAAEPLGIALQAFDLVKLRAGESVAVIGGGPVGLCVAALAQAAGARVVALSEPRSARAKAARALNVQAAVDARPEALIEAARAATGGYGADVVVECSGAAETLNTAILAAARGGRIAIVGIPEVDSIPIDPHHWRRKELLIASVRRSNRTLGRALALLERNDLGLAKAGYFSKLLGLEELQSAFEDLDDPASRAIKLTVDPSRALG